ncbi:MAG: hypothetical protein M1113_00130, partial [Candidatus Thermoplasmatota archaeon]|nr:hypothetical protein [Candidatus Thermoplasmatota archaeon]
MNKKLQVGKVIRSFNVAFELFHWEGTDKEVKKGSKIVNEILGHPFSNEKWVQDSMYMHNCEGGNDSDVFTFICDPSDLEFKEYMARIASRKHNDLTEKGRKGFLHIGIGKIKGINLISSDPDIIYSIQLMSTLHLDVKNFSKWNPECDNELNNIASFGFIIELDSGDEELFSKLKLNSVYVDLCQDINNDQFRKTVKLIRDNTKKITKWNFFYDGIVHDINCNLITLRTFLLFYIWSSFLEDFRKKIYNYAKDAEGGEKNKYIEPCRFVSAIDTQISFLTFESISVSFLNEDYKSELKADSDIFFGKNPLYASKDKQYWYDFLCDVFQIKSYETWGKEFFTHRIDSMVKRDLQGAMYFHNLRLYLSYFEWSTAIKENKIDEESLRKKNLKWDATWGLLIGDLMCIMAQTFIIYNNEIEKHAILHEETTKVFKILKKASIDFGGFYDADLIQSLELRESIEIVKETFLISNYHDRLIER